MTKIKVLTAAAVVALTIIINQPAAAINLEDVEITAMVKQLATLAGKEILVDEKVGGRISVYSPVSLSSDETRQLLNTILELRGFTLVPAGPALKVIPAPPVKPGESRDLGGLEAQSVNENYVARVVVLENIVATEAIPVIRAAVSKDGHITSFGPTNKLLVIDSYFNLEKISGLVRLVDVDKRSELPEVIYLKNADAGIVAKFLTDRAGVRTNPLSSYLADQRLNAVMVFGTEKEKEDARRMAGLLDVEATPSSGKVSVYYLENADALEVAKVLEDIVKGMTPAALGGLKVAGESGRITITPDKATNSLVIMADPKDYQDLQQVIQKLDRKRRQVFVEAMIAEVSLDRASELGVQWGFFGSGAIPGIYDPFGTLTPFFSAVSQLSQSGRLPGGMELGKDINFPFVIKAMQSSGMLNILSSPTILTSDNKEAEIFVGENIPFLGTSTINGATSQQSIERKDTGIRLKITPQITDGDYVKLDVHQEISAIKDIINIGVASTDRSITKRSARTSVIVRDTETVAVGGLISEIERETNSKIPWLSDLPYIGKLFRTKSSKREKTNLILLLTPKVIRDSRDLATTTQQQRGRFSDASQRTKPADILNQVEAVKPAAKPAPKEETTEAAKTTP